MALFRVRWTELTLCTKWVDAENEVEAEDKASEATDEADEREFEGTSDWEVMSAKELGVHEG